MDNGQLIINYQFSIINCFGGLAQLARAPALHAGGQRFESVILHCFLMDNEKWTNNYQLSIVHYQLKKNVL